MSRKEDIERIEKLLKELNFRNYDESKTEELWEIFSHDGFEKEWLQTSEEELKVTLSYIDRLGKITRKDLIEENNPLLYFVLWLVKVYKDE